VAFLLGSIFLPFLEISNHNRCNFGAILFVSNTFVPDPFLGHLLVVCCVRRLINWVRPRDLFHCSCCSLLPYV